jgi:hypothetical protein
MAAISQLSIKARYCQVSFANFSGRGKAAAPVLESFKNWLDAKVLEVPPSLLLGQVIADTLHQKTAKQNGLVPRNYPTLLFKRCPLVKTPENWATLLPWNVKK